MASAGVDLGAGEEGAVPATKTLTAQFAAMALVAEALGEVPWGDADWARLPDAVAEVLADPAPADAAASAIADADGLIAVGRGVPDAGGAGGRAEAARGRGRAGRGMVGGRLPPRPGHRGPVRSPDAGGERRRPGRRRRGGAGGAAGARRLPVLRLADDPAATLPYPGDLPEPLRALPAVVRAQQLALALALRRGLDPDEPSGLSKVTATE